MLRGRESEAKEGRSPDWAGRFGDGPMKNMCGGGQTTSFVHVDIFVVERVWKVGARRL